MDAPANYVHLGFVLISVPNLLLIVGMVVVFAAALLAPFPGHHDAASDDEDPHG